MITGRSLQNAIRTHRSVQSQYNTVCVQRRRLGTTVPTDRGRWAIRSWTGTVQNQDKAHSVEVLPMDRRPSGLLMHSPLAVPVITFLTGLHNAAGCGALRARDLMTSLTPRDYIPPPRKICNRCCLFVCLFVCLSVSNFAQKLPKGFCMKFSGEVGNGPVNK